MRFSVMFELSKMELPKDFRPVFVSFIKNCLSNRGQEYYDEFYEHKLMKSFTFGVRLNRPQFINDTIKLGGNWITFTLSSSDTRDCMLIYNSIMMHTKTIFPLANQNSMKILSVKRIGTDSIESSEILIKMSSPLVVRLHDRETNLDTYVKCTQPDFADNVKQIVAAQLNISGMDKQLIDSFNIMPVNSKCTVTKSFRINIDANLGTYKLEGKPELLNFLYQAGIGSKRSQGFGLFEIQAK